MVSLGIIAVACGMLMGVMNIVLVMALPYMVPEWASLLIVTAASASTVFMLIAGVLLIMRKSRLLTWVLFAQGLPYAVYVVFDIFK